MHHLFTHSAVCPRVPVSQTGLPVPLRAFRARGPWFCGLCLRFRWFYFCCWRTVPVGGLSKACVVLAASRGTNWRELDASTRGRWVAIPEFSREKRGTSHAVCSKGRCLSCTRSCEGSLLTLESWPLGIGEPLTLGDFLSLRFVCFVHSSFEFFAAQKNTRGSRAGRQCVASFGQAVGARVTACVASRASFGGPLSWMGLRGNAFILRVVKVLANCSALWPPVR